MFLLSLTLTGLMILTALIPFRAQSHALVGLSCSVWIMLWGVVIAFYQHTRFPPAVGWLYLFAMAAFAVARIRKMNLMEFQALLLVCALAAYGIAVVEFVPAYREHHELLAKHRAVDLKSRLAYEDHIGAVILPTSFNGSVQSIGPNEAPVYEAAALNELDATFRQYLNLETFRFESKKINRRLAFQALSHAHEDFVADFVAQPGVGRHRLPGLKLLRKSNFIEEWEGVRLDVPPGLIGQLKSDRQAPDVMDKSPSADGIEGLSSPRQREPETPATLPHRVDLLRMHDHNIVNFVPLFSLGGVNDRLQARGFDAHAFHLSPTKSEHWDRLPDEWRLARLELVSLLRHRPPEVYVSDYLPAMDELRHGPTRPITLFEQFAISRLAQGEDLVVEQDSNHGLHMVGSIRAIADCRECHRVPLGGLLGAFTYHVITASSMPAGSAPPPDKQVE